MLTRLASGSPFGIPSPDETAGCEFRYRRLCCGWALAVGLGCYFPHWVITLAASIGFSSTNFPGQFNDQKVRVIADRVKSLPFAIGFSRMCTPVIQSLFLDLRKIQRACVFAFFWN